MRKMINAECADESIFQILQVILDARVCVRALV